MAVVWLLVALLVIGVGYVAAVAWKGVGIRDVWRPGANPARDRDEALDELASLQSLDTGKYSVPCATALYEPDGKAKATLVLYHGFTNCPNQFRLCAEEMRADGYRVLVPRQPRHGLADVNNRALADLTTEDLAAHVDQTIDIAAGFGDEVHAIGLSGGGILAFWAAALRPEVVRALAAAPVAAPTGIPVPLTRLMVRFRSIIPPAYWWWDPRRRKDLGESQYVYPGFPLPGIVPYLHLSTLLADRRVRPAHRVSYAALLSNPGDFAVRLSAARRLLDRTFRDSAEVSVEYSIAKDLGWWHDFVDPDGSHGGTPKEVAEVLLGSLGLSDDGETDGLVSKQTGL